MTAIFYPVAHRSQEEIDTLKRRYELFDDASIPEIFAIEGYTAISWRKPTTWGTSHVVFFVTVKEQPEPLVLRANSGFEKPETYMDVEKQLTDRVAQYSIPVNKIIAVDISRKRYHFDYQIQEVLSGSDLEDHFHGSQDNYDALSFTLGVYIATWGDIHFDGFGRFDAPQHSMYDYMITCLDDDIRYLVDATVFDMKKATQVRKLFDTYKDVMNSSQGVLVHYDLADHNIMFDGKRTITGIFDWEAAVVGDPVLDLASAPTWRTHFPREQKLIEGYRSVRDLPEFFTEKMNIYRLRTMLWKIVYAIRAGILNDDRKKKFNAALAPFSL